MEKVSKPFHPTAPQEAPFLVYFSHGKRGKTQTFYNIIEKRPYCRNIREMSRRTCETYSHGWLIMTHWESKDCFLLNPITLEKIQLPRLLSENDFCYRAYKCSLSSEPTEENCVVFFVSSCEPTIMLCHPGENKWSKIRYMVNEEYGLWNLVSFQGKILGLTIVDSLVVLDFDANPIAKLAEMPEAPLDKWGRRKQTNLVESCGEIFLVLRDKDPVDVITVCVYRVDFAEKKWVRVESIGSDRAFFLCAESSVSCLVRESTIEGDSIYFVENEDPSLYRFDMADRSISVDLPCPNLNEPWYSPHWVFL